MMIWKKAFLFALAGMFFCGCGYTTRSMVSNKYKTIHVVPFVNNIDITSVSNSSTRNRLYRPQLDTDITKAISNKYIFDGNLKVVPAEKADLTLKGEVIDFRRDPLRYDENDEVQEYRVNLLVNLVLWNNRTNEQVWEEKNFTGDTTYFPTTSSLQGAVKKGEAVAIQDAITDLARRVVERTVEEW